MTKLKLPYFQHILRRQGSLEKTRMPGKAEGSRRRGRPNRRWTDCVQEATGANLRRDVEGRTLWVSCILGEQQLELI